MTPKAVYWDMDGTLVDSEPLHARALAAALESLGITPPHDLHERVIGLSAIPVYEMMKREFGIRIGFDDWIQRKYDFYLPRAATIEPRPGALEIFRELRARGVAQAIVSNSDRMVVDANLAAVGLRHFGLKSVSRNDVLNGKPDPEPFLRAAFLTGVDPSESAVVEDSVTGARAGVAAGMRTFFWPQMALDAPAGAVLLHSAADLRDAVGLA